MTATASAPATSTAASTAADLGPRYRSEGWAIAPAALPAPLMDEVGMRLDGLIAALPPGTRPEGLTEPHVRAADWPFWLELCRHPQVLAAVSACLGSDELVLLMTHLIVKPAFDGKAVAWHQDMTYWSSVRGNDAVTVWLAVDDVDVENACMHVIPRTHAERARLEKLATDGSDLLRVRVAVSAADEARAVAVELPRGEFSLHDSFIIHGSTVNRSARRRAGLTMRYGDARTMRIDLAAHHVPIHYVSGDGSRFEEGMYDLRPGRPLPTVPDHRKAGG